MEKLAIVGIFYDGYYDIWEDFLELFEKFGKNCPYDIYIVNNEKDLHFSKKYNVKVIHAGSDAEYSKKVQIAISKIKADYFLLLLEDFFLGKDVDFNKIEKAVAYMKHNKKEYYAMPLPEFFVIRKRKNKIRKISNHNDYILSCQPAIWSRDFLKRCIGTENYNAWVFEGIYAKSKMSHSREFVSKLVKDYRNILEAHHAAVQGKILPITASYYKKIGYNFLNKRPILSKKEYRKYRLKQIISTFPKLFRLIAKKIFGSQSILGKHNDKIDEVMKSMGIE